MRFKRTNPGLKDSDLQTRCLLSLARVDNLASDRLWAGFLAETDVRRTHENADVKAPGCTVEAQC